jgi:hypothetical protein
MNANDPAHVRRRKGNCTLQTFLDAACEQPCPVLLSRTWLLVLSYGGRWETQMNWN